jgi:hypothetical protein
MSARSRHRLGAIADRIFLAAVLGSFRGYRRPAAPGMLLNRHSGIGTANTASPGHPPAMSGPQQPKRKSNFANEPPIDIGDLRRRCGAVERRISRRPA